MKIQSFQRVRDIQDEADLRAALLSDHHGVFGAYWLIDHAPILGLFIRGDEACLFYMPPGGDDLSSFNPSCKDPEGTVEFLIENYQRDAMPADAVIPRKIAEEAFVEFYRSRSLLPGIQWL